MHTPNDDRLIRALHAARKARLTGALRVETRSEGVTLFFDTGQMYFATIDGLRPTTESFERHGIAREMLDTAARAPRAKDRFADALTSIGAPGAAVRNFGMRMVLNGLAKAADFVDAEFSAHDRSHPYGPAFTFDTDELLDTLGVGRTKAEPTSPEPQAQMHDEGGPGFKRRTGLRAAAMAAAERG
jgi:hypothetical protein